MVQKKGISWVQPALQDRSERTHPAAQQLLSANTGAGVRNGQQKGRGDLARPLWEVLTLILDSLERCRIPNCTEQISRWQ